MLTRVGEHWTASIPEEDIIEMLHDKNQHLGILNPNNVVTVNDVTYDPQEGRIILDVDVHKRIDS